MGSVNARVPTSRTFMTTTWWPWSALLGCTVLCSLHHCLAVVERLKNCGMRDFCQGRPPHLRLSPALIDPNIRRSLHCFCDSKCAEYGDCCHDIVSLPAKAIAIRKDLQCVPLSHDQNIFAISSCELGGSTKLLELCTKTVAARDYHYSIDIPVYSNKSSHHYANVYCAICRGEDPLTLVPIKFQIQCTNPANTVTFQQLVKYGKYQIGQLHWTLQKNICYLEPQSGNTRTRPCTSSVSSCPVGSNPLLSDMCTAYSLPVLSEGSKVYKNGHCALCNGVKPTLLTCWQGFKYRSPPSLTIIFDFDWDFDTCNLPISVWDGLRRRCTNMCRDEDDCPMLNNTTGIGKHHLNVLSLKIEGYVTIVCLSISIFCLFLHIFLSCFLPHSKNLPGKILNSLSISLLIAQLLFLCGLEPVIDIPNDACQVVAVLIHFFFLSSFFWMNVMSIDIWQTFSNASFKGQTKRSHAMYALYAWGGAGFVSTVSIIADLTDSIPEDYRPFFAAVPNVCWFGNRTGLAIFFFFPICTLLFLNTALFTITVCWFQKQHRESDLVKNSGRKEYTRLWLYIKLFIIMGLTWCCGMISTFANKPNYRYPYIILNGLQGAFLFIMFDLKTHIFQEFLRKSAIYGTQKNDDKNKRSDGTNTSKLSSV